MSFFYLLNQTHGLTEPLTAITHSPELQHHLWVLHLSCVTRMNCLFSPFFLLLLFYWSWVFQKSLVDFYVRWKQNRKTRWLHAYLQCNSQNLCCDRRVHYPHWTANFQEKKPQALDFTKFISYLPLERSLLPQIHLKAMLSLKIFLMNTLRGSLIQSIKLQLLQETSASGLHFLKCSWIPHLHTSSDHSPQVCQTQMAVLFERGLLRYQLSIMKTRSLTAKLPSNMGSTTLFPRMFLGWQYPKRQDCGICWPWHITGTLKDSYWNDWK